MSPSSPPGRTWRTEVAAVRTDRRGAAGRRQVRPAVSGVWSARPRAALDLPGRAGAGPSPYDGGMALSEEQVARIVEIAMDLARQGDRKSTRLNSSHVAISYAV